MSVRSTFPDQWRVMYVLLVVASLVVVASTLAAVTGRDAAINPLMTLLAGALTGLVVLAAFVGHGRSAARVRVMGLGLVISAIAVIQLAQLWGDGLAAQAWLAVSMLIVVGVLGVACITFGRRLGAGSGD